MADGPRSDNDRGIPPKDEAALSARLKSLGERLDSINAGRPPDSGPGASPPADHSAMARGFRLSTELVGGVLLGAALGADCNGVAGICRRHPQRDAGGGCGFKRRAEGLQVATK
jgi:hypothetical protein